MSCCCALSCLILIVCDFMLYRWTVPFSFLLFLAIVLSDVPSRDSLSSLIISYVIFTSVVSASSLIIIFCLVLKVNISTNLMLCISKFTSPSEQIGAIPIHETTRFRLFISYTVAPSLAILHVAWFTAFLFF